MSVPRLEEMRLDRIGSAQMAEVRQRLAGRGRHTRTCRAENKRGHIVAGIGWAGADDPGAGLGRVCLAICSPESRMRYQLVAVLQSRHPGAWRRGQSGSTGYTHRRGRTAQTRAVDIRTCPPSHYPFPFPTRPPLSVPSGWQSLPVLRPESSLVRPASPARRDHAGYATTSAGRPGPTCSAGDALATALQSPQGAGHIHRGTALDRYVGTSPPAALGPGSISGGAPG